MRVQKADLFNSIAIALGKIAGNVLFGRKAIPKFPIAAELQAFQHRVLSAWEISRVRAYHDPFPRLICGESVSFQILHRKSLFTVT